MYFMYKWRVGLLIAALVSVWEDMDGSVLAQEQAAPGALPMPAPLGPAPTEQTPDRPAGSFLPAAAAAPADAGKPLPINLPTALKLATHGPLMCKWRRKRFVWLRPSCSKPASCGYPRS